MPKPEREPRSRGGARRVLGLVLSIAGLLSTGFGVVNGLNGPSASATASPTTVPLVRSSPSTSTSTSVAPKLTTTTTTAVVAAAPAGREEMQLAPTRVGASSALASTTTSSYGPANAIDGRPETAWCVANDGTGESLTVELAGVPTVTRVGILPGYAKTEGGDRWSENRRPTSVTWSFSSAARYDQSPNTDDRSMQVWSLPSPEQGSRIVLTIGGTTGIANGDTCISEIALFGTR
jgi:hypothetical protein